MASSNFSPSLCDSFSVTCVKPGLYLGALLKKKKKRGHKLKESKLYLYFLVTEDKSCTHGLKIRLNVSDSLDVFISCMET